MKHQVIGDRDRVWTVRLGDDGRIEAELDPALLARLTKARSANEVAAVLSDEVARTRIW